MYAIFILLLLGNPIMLIEGWLLTGLFARVVTIRQAILVPCILLFCVVGSYIHQYELADVKLALFVGLFGYALRKLYFPLAPLVIAYIITPIAERSLKQALILSDGDYSVFFVRPIAGFFMLLSVLIIVLSFWKPPWERSRVG